MMKTDKAMFGLIILIAQSRDVHMANVLCYLQGPIPWSLANAEGLLCITKTYLYNFGPLKPHFLYSKSGVYRGIHYFSYFCSKHRLWVFVRTASPRRF